MRSALALLSFAGLAACSPGVGRPPIHPDASTDRDAGFAPDAIIHPDAATFPDAEPYDGSIALPDAEPPPPPADFSGIFGILNSNSPLYAREVGSALNLVVDDFPYVYNGTIDDEGTVDVVSPELTHRGCAVARITGDYDRTSATYVLLHQTCNANGDPLSSQITGGFFDNFVPAFSGIFQLDVVVNAPNGCWTGPLDGIVILCGFNFLQNGIMTAYCGQDLVAAPQWYRGAADRDGSFSAIDPAFSVSMNGRFEMPTVNDPLRFIGLRDVWDATKACGFTVTLDGVRVAVP